VAINQKGNWLLHAGDAYFDHREVHLPERACAPALDIFQTLNQTDKALRLQNQDRLRRLASSNSSVTIFCAHDPSEYENMKAKENAL
jgi:hypothetical protein